MVEPPPEPAQQAPAPAPAPTAVTDEGRPGPYPEGKFLDPGRIVEQGTHQELPALDRTHAKTVAAPVGRLPRRRPTAAGLR
ncbi:hypothetical protein ACWGI9_45300 [Streptomyces sp. NPDC054833]